MNPLAVLLAPKCVNGPRRHEDQRVCLDWEMIKIDAERRRSVCHPENLVKIVPVRTLPVLAVSEPFFKRAHVKLFSGSGGVIRK